MSAADAAAIALCALGVVLGGARWLRVAQREHYLPGAAGRFARRWWTVRPANGIVATLGVVGLGLAALRPWAVSITGIAVCCGPVGLSVRGRTSRLVFTARLRRLTAVSVLLGGAPIAAAAAFGGLGAATIAIGAVAGLLPVVVDGAMLLALPVEARYARRFVRSAVSILERVRPTVVAITGSYGKTSTKGYVAHLLGSRFTVLASPRSFNNAPGLARTVNEHLLPGTDVLVAEMGTYGPGEIAAMCAWLPPTIAAITAIGPVHLERFGTLERTLAAKSEITEGAKTVVLNTDDPRLAVFRDRLVAEGRTVVSCSASDPSADVAIIEDASGALAWYRSGGRVADLDREAPALGAARTNVAVAIAIALALGCGEEEITPRLGDLPVAESRIARSHLPNGAIVLDDTFNANPAGTRVALEALAHQRVGRRVLVTPGMVELGPRQVEENAAFAAAAAAVVDDLVVVARTNRRALVSGARAVRPEIAVRVTERREDAVAWVRASVPADAAVLYENDLPDHYP